MKASITSVTTRAMELTRLVDLACAANGGKVEEASDDFFGPKERLILPDEPVRKPGVYTEHGKWMDGWESRRKRTPGNDWCVVRLGFRGRIRAVDIDTSFFVGNHPPEASVDFLDAEGDDPDAGSWQPLLDLVPLQADEHNVFETSVASAATHVRLNIFPDGGVARLRVYGDVVPDWSSIATGAVVELSALAFGGLPAACSDEHFGCTLNLLRGGASVSMGDGWETRRRRVPGHDWVVIQLGRAGTLDRIEVDTTHFKGNYPDRCSVDACLVDESPLDFDRLKWIRILGETKLGPDALHMFDDLAEGGPFSHLRLNIYPDGGVARFRAFGRIARLTETS